MSPLFGVRPPFSLAVIVGVGESVDGADLGGLLLQREPSLGALLELVDDQGEHDHRRP